MVGLACAVFFLKQKTAYDVRISDWSSDVCSSELARGQAAEQPQDLSAGLHQPVDVGDQQQHILMGVVAEMLGDGQGSQAGAPARARRLVHLAEHQRGAWQHAGLAQLQQQFMALARPLADRSEEHTSELQSLMRSSYAVFCLKKKTNSQHIYNVSTQN